MKKVAFPLLAITLVGLVACTNMSGQQQGTLTGAGIGAGWRSVIVRDCHRLAQSAVLEPLAAGGRTRGGENA